MSLLSLPTTLVTTSQLKSLGADDRRIRQSVLAGEIVRLGRGVFADGESWRQASPEEQHQLSSLALLMTIPSSATALSHDSAAVWHELPLLGTESRRVHLTARGSVPTRSRAGYTRHEVPDELIRRYVLPSRAAAQNRIWMTTPAASVTLIARDIGLLPGLIAADAAVHRELLTLDDLTAAASCLGRSSPSLRTVLSCTTAGSESPGESATKWLLHQLGVAYIQQERFVDSDGFLIARVDFLLPELGVILEFDGVKKYGNATDLVKEKHREDELRGLGYVVVRLVWSELSLETLRTKIERAAKMSHRQAPSHGGRRVALSS